MSNKRIIIGYILLICSISIFATSNNENADSLVNEIEIWPGVGPGSDTLTIEENIIVRGLSGTCSRDWAIEKITVPTITPVIPENPNGSAVVICPGGAYKRVVYDVEGLDIGQWLNSIGITAFVLKYRLPLDEHIDKKNVPLQDAQRALRYVRAHAEEYGLDASKIGIMGASAGGHVASTLASSFNKEVYEQKDYLDSISARPDFMLLLYPVISMESGVTHTGSRLLLLGDSPDQATINEFSAEKNVTKDFPITFMTRASDDTGVPADNCNFLYKALQDSGIVSELKIFERGGHGVGICKTGTSDFAKWPDYCTNWLHENKLTEDSVIIVEEKPEAINNIDIEWHPNFNINPNPISNNSVVSYEIVQSTHVSMKIYDISGKQAATVVNDFQKKGSYEISLAAYKNKFKGIYLVHFQTGNDNLNRKVYF